MRTTLGAALRRHGMCVAAAVFLFPSARAFAVGDGYYDLFASPMRNGRSVEGLIDLDKAPVVSHLADGRSISSWVTYDAKRQSTFQCVPELDEAGNGLVVGEAVVQWFFGKDEIAAFGEKQHHVPVVGKASVRESRVETFGPDGHSSGVANTLSERFGWKGSLREGSESTSMSFKYAYASSPKGVRESGALAVRHGDAHQGRSSVTIADTTRSLGLFRGDDPVARPKVGQWTGAAVFETEFADDGKTGRTLTGGTFALAVKPVRSDANLGTYRATARLGYRSYAAAGIVDIGGIDLGNLADPELLFADPENVFVVGYRFASPAAQESYRVQFK